MKNGIIKFGAELEFQDAKAKGSAYEAQQDLFLLRQN